MPGSGWTPCPKACSCHDFSVETFEPRWTLTALECYRSAACCELCPTGQLFKIDKHGEGLSRCHQAIFVQHCLDEDVPIPKELEKQFLEKVGFRQGRLKITPASAGAP